MVLNGENIAHMSKKIKIVLTKIPEKMQKDPIFTHKFQVKKTCKSFALSRCMEKLRFKSAWGSKVFSIFT